MREIFKDPIGFVRLVAFYVRQGWGVWRASRDPRPLLERWHDRRAAKRYDVMFKKDTSKGVGK